MYKKQMLFQKIMCMLALIAAALVFVYSLGMSTDLYDALARTILYPDYDLEQTSVAGSRVYYDMFAFNKTFTKVSIGLILVAVLLFITNTNVRRKYYSGNYISTGLFTVSSIGVAVWAIPQIMDYKSQYQQKVDFEALKTFSENWGTLYIGPEDTFWFDISYAVFGFLILTAVLLVINMILKILVMKAEQNAIGKGRSV